VDRARFLRADAPRNPYRGSELGVCRVGAEGFEPPSLVLADLVRALKVLSPNQRSAVILCLYADLPGRDVARIMRCSQTTVRVHLSQARRRLRPLLEDTDA
jgi:DNA-directed RNA polymerase specialized sigma24 family protein